MAEISQQRVFISYARRDGAELARRLQNSLTACKGRFDVWLDTRRIHGGDSWTSEIEEAIDRAEVILALVTPGSYVSEICRAEQLRSLRKGKCVIPVIAVSGSDIPLHLETKTYRDFTQGESYDREFQVLLGDIANRKGVALAEHYRATPTQWIQAPPMVANYIDQPEVIRGLRDTLFKSGGHRAVALTAIQGMGGIGKTVLAQALLRDEVVKQAFPDGLVWITVGREPKHDVGEKLREIATVLGSKSDGGVTPETLYRSTIGEKAALIVIDDIWSKEDLEPFLAESPRSRYLFTTRDSSIAKVTSAREHQVELLDPPHARDLLAAWAGVRSPDLPPSADDILRECGRLPLALSIVGASLKGAGRADWTDMVEALRNVDLSAIEQRLPKGQRSFFRAIETSVKAQPGKLKQAYLKLRVLLDDMPAALPLLQTLWAVNEADARRIGLRLAECSLALRDEEGALRLHDLQLDYIRAKAKDQPALKRIHSATRQSAYVIGKDPQQYASQLLGRLLEHRNSSAIDRFLKQITAGTPGLWFRPLTPSLAAERCLRWLRPTPEESLSRVAFSANGAWAAHSGYRHEGIEVVLWNIREWRCCGGLFRFRQSIFALALSDDARSCVFSDSMGGVYHWRGSDGEIRHCLAHQESAIPNPLAISADGCRAVSACTRGLLIAWNLVSMDHETISDEPQNIVTAISLSRDGDHIAAARQDGSIETADLWPVRRRQSRPLGGAVAAIARSSDNSLIAIAMEDGRIEMRSMDTFELVRILAMEEQLSAITISSDRQNAAAGSSEGSVAVWSIGSGRRTAFYRRAHTWEIEGIAFDNERRTVVSADRLQFKEWMRESGEGRREADACYPSGQVRVTPDGCRAVAVLEDGRLGVWDVFTGALESRLPSCGTPFRKSRLRPHEKLPLAATTPRVLAWDETLLSLWDLSTASCIGSISAKKVHDAAIAADGAGVIYATDNEAGGGTTLYLWKPDEGSHTVLERSEDRICSVAISPDGQRALSCDRSWCIEWSLADAVNRPGGRELRRFWTAHGGDARIIAYVGSSNAVFATDKGLVFSLNADEREEPRELRGQHRTWVSDLLTSRDGAQVVTSSHDETVRVWDVKEGCCKAVFDAHPGNLQQLSASGERLLLSSRAGVIKLLSLEDGRLMAAFEGDKQITTCAGNAELTRVVGIDERGQLHFLSLEGEI